MRINISKKSTQKLIILFIFIYILNFFNIVHIVEDKSRSQVSVEAQQIVAIHESGSQERIQKDTTCDFYLAQSSIPNSGWGAYTTRDIQKGENGFLPEIVIPIFEIEKHVSAKKYKWLFDSYVWQSDIPGTLVECNYTDSFIPGLGAQSNSFSGLNNIILTEDLAERDNAGLHRGKDPGAGAITYYVNMKGKASQYIKAGSEIFTDYGDNWFKGRTKTFGKIPLKADFKAADDIVMKFVDFKKKQTSLSDHFLSDLWNVTTLISTKRTRTLNAFPISINGVDHAHAVGTARHSLPKSTQDINWLKENGLCMDNIVPNISSIPQAGRGLFATRKLLNGDFVAPLPLIQIKNKQDLNMYDQNGNVKLLVGKQLLLNYCYSHRKSTLLFCSYGAMVNFINHDSQNPNVKLRWSKYEGTKIDWFNKTVEELPSKSAGLMFEFEAIRDIEDGEELLLDYGRDWEQAWTKHVDEFQPSEKSKQFISALDIPEDEPIRTYAEQVKDPYPSNVKIWCYYRNVWGSREPNGKKWSRTWNNVSDYSAALRPCNVTSRSYDGKLYTAIMTNGGRRGTKSLPKNEIHEVTSMPRNGIRLVDEFYTSDLFLKGAFRHPIGIPDEIFPKIWMNKPVKET